MREENIIVKEGKYWLGNLISSSVPSRRYTTIHRPVGATSGYTAGQTISFKLPQSGYLDVESSYVKFSLVVSDKTDTVFLGSNSLVKRLVVKDGQNNILEDINNYNVLHMLIRRAMACQDQNASREMLNGSGCEEIHSSIANGLPSNGSTFSTASNRYFVLTLDLSGILGNLNKYLPLEHISNGLYFDIVLERNAGVLLCPTGSTRSYTVNDVSYVADIVEFNELFENEFKKYLQEYPLELYYHSYTSHTGAVPTGSVNNSFVISEKASSLKDLYFCIIPDTVLTSIHLNPYTFTPLVENFSVSLQLGNQRIPQYPMTNHVDVYTELRKSFNVLNDQVMGGLIDYKSFTTATTANSTDNGKCTLYCMGLNLETHLASSVDGNLVLSGKDSKSVANNMVLQISNGNGIVGAQTIYMYTHTDRIYSVDSFGKGVVSY